VVNYNGQLTNQTGVHSRWEAELFERNRGKLKIAPAPIKPVTNPRDFMFETLLGELIAHRPGVLESDVKAAAGREFYDDAYFEAFGQGALPVLEKRLNESIASVAAMITGAWESAGKPGRAHRVAANPAPIRRPK
jgi:hypothetical protein